MPEKYNKSYLSRETLLRDSSRLKPVPGVLGELAVTASIYFDIVEVSIHSHFLPADRTPRLE